MADQQATIASIVRSSPWRFQLTIEAFYRLLELVARAFELPISPLRRDGTKPMTTLLSKDHPITEKGMMEFQPFGNESDGTPIRDISGVVVRALVEHLEETVGCQYGPAAGRQAVEDLVQRLNERIPDRAFHVTADFLKNTWNSFSSEFTVFLTQFCWDVSGGPQFSFNMGRNKAISPVIQVLGRPFSVSQIYKMSAYFSQRFANNGFHSEAVQVSIDSALIQMRLSGRALRQFGAYVRACALMYCMAHKGYLSAVPEKFHGLSPASVRDRHCIAEGEDFCEWEVHWSVKQRGGPLRRAIVPVARRILRKELDEQEALMEEQIRTLDSRHVELQETNVRQQQFTADLQRRVDQLTALHETGLVFVSTLDREALIERVLQSITQKLNYDRAMITFFDPERRVAHDFRLRGVSGEVAAFARSLEVPVSDPESVEGRVLLKGEPILVGDIHEVKNRLHPLYQRLEEMVQAKSFVAVPLKIKDTVLGALTVDRAREHRLGQDDVDLIATVASQVAIALDNTNAYRRIEELIAGLEAKVRERTGELERANERLRELDRLKSEFLAHVSHELRTPLTSIKGFAENMLDGLGGRLSEKQEHYLTRIRVNGMRLERMISDLLDRSRIESGKIELALAEVALPGVAAEVIEQLRMVAEGKRQRLQLDCSAPDVTVWADADRLSQILTNLIDNAIKYTPEEGTVMVRVARQSSHTAKISVSDTGEGISPDALPKLFDRFFRVSRRRRSPVKGLGLGLSIVKDLVELHGGVIAVKSEEGKGTEFTVTLPIRSAAEPKVTHEPHAGRCILVVDDDPDVRQLLYDRLGTAGYHVQLAVDGREALAALRETAFDGVVLDIGLPDIAGVALLRQIRDRHPVMPVVMITAAQARERAALAMEAGAQACLRKPFDVAQLTQVIEQWVGPAQKATVDA
jgi:signal transduction histidine kinase/ActR/RegA family two-component response regulator